MKHISTRKNGPGATDSSSRGYSLLEILMSLAILALVTGTVFEQINAMQKKSNAEAMKLDMNQQAREFLDQTVRDLHMAGYPSANMYSSTPRPSQVAAGLVRVSPTEILLEGDVNNDGNVYSVDITYLASDPIDPTCPCIRRSAQAKVDLAPLSQGVNPNYTETQQVLPPGTNAGQSGEDLFTYYDQNGTAINVVGGIDISTPQNQAVLASIKTIKISLSLVTGQRDPETGALVRTSMSATAMLSQ